MTSWPRVAQLKSSSVKPERLRMATIERRDAEELINEAVFRSERGLRLLMALIDELTIA